MSTPFIFKKGDKKMKKIERIGLITVDMEYSIATIEGDKDFFCGDNNSIEIQIENKTEEIGDVCYYAANTKGQVVAGTTVLTDGKYVINKESMDLILNYCGEVIIQIQIYNTEKQRITCTDTVSIKSLLNFDRKETDFITPELQVNLAELLEIAKKIQNGEFNVIPGAGTTGGTGKDGVTFTPFVSSAGIISWTNDGGLKNPTPVSIMGPQGPAGEQGAKGEAGKNGLDGTSISTIVKKTENSNVIVITLTDKTKYEIEIPTIQGKDGKDGEQGPAGKDGEDYILTDSDKQEIAEIATASLSSEIGDIGAILDEINGEVI